MSLAEFTFYNVIAIDGFIVGTVIALFFRWR